MFRSSLRFRFICKMTSFPIYFVTVAYATASHPSTCTSSVWTSLAESPFRWETRQLASDPYCLTYGRNERSR
jgi:hypothetical protein